MIRQKEIYPHDAYPPSSYCRMFYRGAQNSGDLANRVIGGAQAIKHPSFTDETCFATPGFFTVGGTATDYADVAAATANLESLATHTLIVAARVQKVAPAFPGAEGYLYASYKPGSEYGGIVLASRVDGSARLYINSTDNTTVSLTTAANVITNGSVANERSLVFVVPREGGNGYVAIDGIEAVASTINLIAGKNIKGDRFGRFGVSLAGVAAGAHRLASFQVYCVPKAGSQLSRELIYDWIARNPHLPALDWVFGL